MDRCASECSNEAFVAEVSSVKEAPSNPADESTIGNPSSIRYSSTIATQCIISNIPKLKQGKSVISIKRNGTWMVACESYKNAFRIDAISGKTHDDYVRTIWSQAINKDITNFFTHDSQHLVSDGGVRDVPQLGYTFQYFKAAFTASAVLFNIFMIAHLDVIEILRHRSEGDQKFLTTKHLVGGVLDMFGLSTVNRRSVRVFSAVELLLLLFFLLKTFRRIIQILAARLIWALDDATMMRWVLLSRIFRADVHALQHYSGMRLLHFLSPPIISSDAYKLILHVRQRWNADESQWSKLFSASKEIIPFVVLRIVALVVGIDAFFVKFRIVRHDLELTDEWTKQALWNCLGFIYQLLGVVSVSQFVRERLCMFVFAGKSGNLDCDEEAILEAWYSFLTKSVYDEFGWWRGTLIMLGFDDYDFQMLALDDDEENIKQREVA
jgi:hypothetical protein